MATPAAVDANPWPTRPSHGTGPDGSHPWRPRPAAVLRSQQTARALSAGAETNACSPGRWEPKRETLGDRWRALPAPRIQIGSTQRAPCGKRSDSLAASGTVPRMRRARLLDTGVTRPLNLHLGSAHVAHLSLESDTLAGPDSADTTRGGFGHRGRRADRTDSERRRGSGVKSAAVLGDGPEVHAEQYRTRNQAPGKARCRAVLPAATLMAGDRRSVVTTSRSRPVTRSEGSGNCRTRTPEQLLDRRAFCGFRRELGQRFAYAQV